MTEWEYYQVRKLYDPFGQELPSEKCTYCGKQKPVQLFELDGHPAPFHSPAYAKVMMKQVKIKDRIQWVCLDCLNDLSLSV
jgi:hypothetical protein